MRNEAYKYLPIQTSTKGNPYQVIGVFRVPNTTEWNGKFQSVQWIRYVDTGDRLWLWMDGNGKVTKKQIKQPENLIT